MAGKLKIFSLEEHARVKGMWAGALTKVEIPNLLGAYEEEVQLAGNGVEASVVDGDDSSSVADDESASVDGRSVASGEQKSKIITRVKSIDNHHTPTILKIMDELMVNASDHERGCRGNKPSERVTYINITFESDTGRFTIENDGPGIDVEIHEQATHTAGKGRQIYCPEVAFAMFLAGTNLDKEISNVKGGTNGVGAKLAMVHARRARIETVDSSKRYYSQEFKNRLRERSPPTIINLASRGLPAEVKNVPLERRKPHTRVEMTPAYGELGYSVTEVKTGTVTGDPNLRQADSSDLDGWLRMRAHQIAAYVGSKVRVVYNGKRCMTLSAKALASLYSTMFGDESAGQTIILPTVAKATEEPYNQHPWDIAIMVLPSGIKGLRGAQHMTLVNGTVCNKGSHITYFKKLMSDAVVTKVESATKSKTKSKSKTAKSATAEKKYGVGDTMTSVRIVACGPLPGAEWGGQRKDELMVPPATLKKYSLSDAFLKKAAIVISDRMLAAMGVKTGKRGPIEKYVKARRAGGATGGQCALLAAEGDSALRLLRLGLSQNKGAKRPAGCAAGYLVPSYDYCGTITLGGVVMNAIKETSEIETKEGETLMVRSEKLRSNVKLRALVDAMHLEFGKLYSTARERASLQYGFLFGCVDQDLDGCGKILSLLLVFIFMFWPNLIKEGKIGRFLTPVIRMYPKKSHAKTHPVLEFSYEEEAREYMQAHSDWETYYTKPTYYKGLAAHEDDEVKRMFKPDKFNSSLYIFTLDDAAKELFNVYFGGGKDGAAKRKEVLRIPVQYLTYEEAQALHRSRLIPCSMHMQIDTKAFKLEAIRRQIPHVFDGLVPSRRKVLDGAMAVFGSKNAALKVFQLGGRIAADRFYHHGDQSLNDTITRMAQCFRDARQYPFLIGVGAFGSRHLAGKDAGSARYIGVKLSPLAKAAFSPRFRWLLPFVMEEGNRAEPEFMVGVAPIAVIEGGGSRPSEGWMHMSFSRDYDSVMKVVNALLAGDEKLTDAANRVYAEGPTEPIMETIAALEKKYPLPVSTRNFTGKIRQYKGDPYSFGDYWWEESTRTIHVTELPIGTPTGGDEKLCGGFICGLTKQGRGGKENPLSAYIESVEDYSSDTAVDVYVKLKPGAFEKITEAYGDAYVDPIEDFLKLRDSLRSRLNYVGRDGTVLEFGQSYLGVLLYWFPAIRDLYRQSLERDAILLDLRIREENNILNYCAVYDELGLKHLDEEKASELLTEREFDKFDSRLLHSPGFTLVEDLYELITSGPKTSHDYLLDLADRVKLPSQVAKRRANLSKLEAELKEVQKGLAETPFAGVSTWKQDLATFDSVVKAGIASGWKFKKSHEDSADIGDGDTEKEQVTE